MTRISLTIFAALALAACGPAPNDQNQPSSAQSQAAAQSAPSRTHRAERRTVRREPRYQEEPAPRAESRSAPVCGDCGTVTAIQPVAVKGQPSMLGTLAGAAAGGLLGSQFGKGTGKAAMTGVGVLGGALAGRAIEGEVRSTTIYRVTVAMDAGGTRTIDLAAPGGLAVGAQVRINGNTITPR
ncbi:MAG: glycine zipper 2TM domain-containing protein [Gammaproteobacteria bacterium]|nr:glycine zipper 2TM domain-containing protein [Gammaproteobacteria bacterium]